MIDTREFKITVLGRTLEHLGVQMYKQRSVAIAELVANCWDACAGNVYITVPREDTYDHETSEIVILDDGSGMTPDEIEEVYLTIGRNRRSAAGAGSNGNTEVKQDDGGESEDSTQTHLGTEAAVTMEESAVMEERRPMGRKGIGKLAGFGLAKKMVVETWSRGRLTCFALDIERLKMAPGDARDIPIHAEVIDSMEPTNSGTRITLRDLKNERALILQDLRTALGRRFSRTIRGRMAVYVNEELVTEPPVDLALRFPEAEGEFVPDTLSDGTQIRYYYGFSKTTIKSPDLRGFTIYVRGKTAQAPNFYFNVEATTSGQHGLKYLIGAVEADYLDDGVDDESDIISTDRQEIDWEHKRTVPLHEWGADLTRRILTDYAQRRGEDFLSRVFSDQTLNDRIERLDDASKKQLKTVLRTVGKAEPDDEKMHDLADGIIKAYEYRHFYDVITEIEQASEDPQELYRLLDHLSRWRVLESRAILEIVHGRLKIVDKFESMIVNDVPETAPRVGVDNLHDLIAQYPWLINPEWQIFSEEKTITRTLRDWNVRDIGDIDTRERYDFLALTNTHDIVVIEIKRSSHPVDLEELQRLERYGNDLALGRSITKLMMIHGGTLAVNENLRKEWEESEYKCAVPWKALIERTRLYYEHYRALLEGDVQSASFHRKTVEIGQTRRVLEHGTYRGKERRGDLGPQDIDYSEGNAAR